MNPPPIALGLTICEKVIVEERTRNLTLVNTFTKMFADDFPTTPERFAIGAVLTGGRGDATIDLMITHLATDDEAYSMRQSLRFPDRLGQVQVIFHIRECSFPEPGEHDATLFVDGDPIARRRFAVNRRS